MEIREASCDDAAAIARVHVESWRTSYRDFLPEDFLAHLSVERREQQWREQLCAENSTAFCFVAEADSKQIVGFASGGAARSDREKCDGELYAIYLLEAYQRRGIGKE
ncbi:MAG: GNAT family N-acetyltransferase, partial [Chloroflexi bacterium]|nr:GNAT family N-acetyltransferase [Chloroflexota bacterium]